MRDHKAENEKTIENKGPLMALASCWETVAKYDVGRGSQEEFGGSWS